MRRLRLSHAGIAIPMLILLWSARAQDATAPFVTPQPANRSLSMAYQGSGSCSAVACHGAIAPLAGSTVRRNEHTTWISDDRHSRAFQILFDNRSKRIARNLAGERGPVPAHEDARCLACHTTPRPESIMRTSTWMNPDGVGCESCHGSAEKWLGRHTTDGWRRLSRSDKQHHFGFTDTKDLVRRAELCAGCHLGEAAADGLPPRDVNHDLIAAGHPRLNFEFASYHENQPRHWKLYGLEMAADFPVRAWALGQLVSARSALELLRSRCDRAAAKSSALPLPLPGLASTPAPWPEFAEYGCFSCHHSLADEPWRKNRATSGVPAGAAVWGSWYYPIVGELLEIIPGAQHVSVTHLQAALKSLVAEMSRPIPNPDKVKSMAEVGIKALDDLIREYSIGPTSSRLSTDARVEHLIEVFNHLAAWKKVASWDEAAQRYLALVPLNQARGRLNSERRTDQKALTDELRALVDKLVYPKNFDSPRGFDPSRLPVGR